MQKVIIASQNPVKIRAVQDAFAKVFSDIEFIYEGVNVTSGVPEQPLGDEETLLGAKTRVHNISTMCNDDNAMIVGLEGGVTIDDLQRGWSYAWIYIQCGTSIGIGKTAMLELPSKIVQLIQDGKELGEADDIVFGETNSKQKMGTVGLLTNGLIDRSMFYEHACILACVPFLQADLY